MQSQQPLGRPDSPLDANMNLSTNTNLHHHQHHPHSQQDSIYNLSPPQAAMYSNNIDYTSDPEQRQPASAKVNGFGSVPSASYRNPSFPSFPNNTRQRHLPSSSSAVMPSNTFRETPNSYYPSSNDVYSMQMTSPTQAHVPAFDPRGSYDFGAPQQSAVGSNQKYVVDPYASSGAASGPMHHQLSGKALQPHQPQANGFSTQNSYSAGVHITSQTPYGPHIPASASSGALSGPTAGASSGMSMPSGLNVLNGATARAEPAQEEISTIFVVGFPDDMQEREFQNMFTFSAGFEAATLKIPNKEYTSYGGAMQPGMRPGAAGYAGTYGGQNDPYNLVTVNQGGVVVDAGRDGTFASWPASAPEEGIPSAHYMGPNMPRKQIIGFAKFRSREEALSARDVLQGRRVDIEKGAVLKAEMARKNLHTKRGVAGLTGNGATGGMDVGPLGSAGSLQPGMISGLNGAEAYGMGNGPEMTARDRELGALGAMGLGLGSRMTQWRERLPDATQQAGPTPGTHGRNGRVREREEEERRKERDAAMAHIASFSYASGEKRRSQANVTAYEAFHSVPMQMSSRQTSQTNGTSSGLLAAHPDSGMKSISGGASPMMGGGFPPSAYESGIMYADEPAGPWDREILRSSESVAVLGSQRSSSPHQTTSSNTSNPDFAARSFSPTHEAPEQHHHHSQSGSSSSSLAEGSQGGGLGSISSLGAIGGERINATDDVTRGVAGLAVSTNGGNTSPQLPSPASGASSGGSAKNAVDQNPPINTLYVGNLPNTPSPTVPPPDSLEERLRDLFSTRPGYRRLCFRQKNNGPMCFVEFEDIPYATRALNELYGNTLNGLVKGGIRLSYSKNPLGVRTPTSAGSTAGGMQHQQMQAALLQQQQSNGSFSLSAEAFASRLDEQARPTILRRDTNPAPPPSASYVNGGSFMMSSPPPRFVSPTPSTTTFTAASASAHAFIPRSSHHSLNGYAAAGFAPFGLASPSILEQAGDNEQQQQQMHYMHRDMTPPCNVEAARAG
ncbi:hypothetical protein HGRIS_010158 [Hohenbuehelia grisea]|uniref:RRM domain-containing protein n=1 Tax=Hohenbuehelia grisea TaxID=104357 RepID=A0ABR3J3F2_9AGAR